MKEERGTCVLCGDTGSVIVPHPRFTRGGGWDFHCGSQPTAGVVCTCWIGQRIEQGQLNWSNEQAAAHGGRQMTLAEYEQQMPRVLWQRWLQDRDREQWQKASAMPRPTAKARV